MNSNAGNFPVREAPGALSLRPAHGGAHALLQLLGLPHQRLGALPVPLSPELLGLVEQGLDPFPGGVNFPVPGILGPGGHEEHQRGQQETEERPDKNRGAKVLVDRDTEASQCVRLAA